MDEPTFPTLTMHIVVRDAKAAIAFYEKALGAKQRWIMHAPNSEHVMNAQLEIGDSMLMLNDEFPDYGAVGPQPGEQVHATIHVTSKDVDTDFQRAVDAGATVTMPLEDMFWGDRYGQFTDPFGYKWSMGQKTRDLTPEQMQAEMAAQMPG